LRRAGYNPGGDGFIGFGEIFDGGVRDGNEVGFEVFGGVGSYEGGGDDGGEGFGGEVAAAMVSASTFYLPR